jgi:glycosyltransferase involved in cell wall biosynthesis
VVHCWGRTALRAVAAVGGAPGAARLFASAALPPARHTNWFDGWLLRRANVVMAFSEAEADRCRRLGVRAERLAVVAPGVRPAVPTKADVDIPVGRLLFATGPIEPHKGFRDAVWALDILHYLYDDLRLVLAGDGSDRPRLEEFARAIEVDKRVVMLGHRPDLTPWLHSAELVWIPSRTSGGECAALEAMAAGRPVIATRLPNLAEIIADGVAGCLVPPGDKTELARQTRFLLNDPDRRRAYGEAGRRRAVEHFSVEALASLVGGSYNR